MVLLYGVLVLRESGRALMMLALVWGGFLVLVAALGLAIAFFVGWLVAGGCE